MARSSTLPAPTDDLVSYPCPGPARCDPQPEYVAPVIAEDDGSLEDFKLKSALLCDGCRAPLLLAGVIATATGRCSDCAPVLPAITWDFIERGNGLDFIECNWWQRCLSTTDGAVPINDGDVVGHAVRRYCTLSAERSRFAGETRYEVDVVDGAAPDGDTLDEIAYDLNSKRRRYQGKVVDPNALPFVRAAAVVAKIESDREPAGFRAGAIDALGLGVCAKCEDLACDCACSKARREVAL